MLTLRNDHISLPDDIYELLVHYYNVAYDWNFVTIAGESDKLVLEEKSEKLEDFIVVLPNIIQHGRIRIGSEDNEMVDIFSGKVQFFFTHTIVLPPYKKFRY